MEPYEFIDDDGSVYEATPHPSGALSLRLITPSQAYLDQRAADAAAINVSAQRGAAAPRLTAPGLSFVVPKP